MKICFRISKNFDWDEHYHQNSMFLWLFITDNFEKKLFFHREIMWRKEHQVKNEEIVILFDDFIPPVVFMHLQND